jgi:hypothetical protein
MLLEAKWGPDSGLQRGQLLVNIRASAKEWGMKPTYASKFLHKCVEEGDISMVLVDRKNLRSQGTEQGTQQGTGRRTQTRNSALLVTILNYDRYQPKQDLSDRHEGTQEGTDECRSQGTSSNNIKRTYKKNTLHSVVTANSQVYNFFIETRRQALNIKDWVPSASQAKQLRTNINKLLEFRSPDVIIEWLKNYFADQRMEAEMWPWTFFMSDPVRWSRPRNESHATSNEGEEIRTILDAKKAREERLRRLESRNGAPADAVPA